MTDREREARIRERETICEVNGVVVLCRRPGGTLEAPEGLEGIAAYFESEGTPEELYEQCRDALERRRMTLVRIANLDVTALSDEEKAREALRVARESLEAEDA